MLPVELTSEASELIQIAIENAAELMDSRCQNHAPFIAYKSGNDVWYLVQGCCNSWYCPRCAIIRARHEYGRMVEGAKTLAERGHELYFVTLTCDSILDAKSSDSKYLEWTNRLLSNWRAKTKKEQGYWAYVQVTERQKRGHAHSHLICTMIPDDCIYVSKNEWSFIGYKHKRDGLYSDWLTKSAMKAGLGAMCDISIVRNPAGVAVYAAKYLFKDISATSWPTHWKRIRYSQSWPKAIEKESNQDAFPVIRAADWNRVRELPKVYARGSVAYEACLAALCLNALPVD